MKKLLHERLREFVLNESVGSYWELRDACNEEVSANFKDLAQFMADEIERYYISRPRFEDGEPVQWDDEVCYNTTDESVESISFSRYGTYSINPDERFERWIGISEPVKRSSPKVLDADGVEIKVGDTVWCIDTGTKLKVISQDCIDGTLLCDNDFIYDPDVLTHKEPDSFEKLLEYLEGKYNLCNYELDKVRDRLSALIEGEK